MNVNLRPRIHIKIGILVRSSEQNSIDKIRNGYVKMVLFIRVIEILFGLFPYFPYEIKFFCFNTMTDSFRNMQTCNLTFIDFIANTSTKFCIIHFLCLLLFTRKLKIIKSSRKLKTYWHMLQIIPERHSIVIRAPLHRRYNEKTPKTSGGALTELRCSKYHWVIYKMSSVNNWHYY